MPNKSRGKGLKKIGLSILASVYLSSFAVAGGDLKEVEPAVVPVIPMVEEESKDQGWYLGLGYAHLSHDVDYEDRGTENEIDHHAVMLAAGYKFNSYFALEGRYWETVGDADHEISPVATVVDTWVDSDVSVLSIYAKPIYPIAPEMDIYALLGYAWTEVSNTSITSLDEGAFSWGAGASYDINEHYSVFAEYTQFYNDTLRGFDHVVDSFNIGLAYKFSDYTGEAILPALTVGDKDVEEENFYLGAAIVAVSTRDASVSMDIFYEAEGQDRLGNVSLHAGYEFNNYLAVEGRYSTSITDDDHVTMPDAWGVFLKPMYKFEDEEERAAGENYFAVYGLLGFGGMTIEGSNQYTADVDDTGFQWGLGVSYTFRTVSDTKEYKYKDSWTVFADYTSLANDMDGIFYNGATKVDADAFTVGVNYKF